MLSFLFCFAFFFILAQFLSGEFAVCEPCWLGRGKCRRICTEDEKVVGNCKMNFFCCRRRISTKH
uniref:Beta-defensin n=2 Tax=Canis lupus familiaris TaxID=9615 RepID=A0A8I3P7F1_CANLF